jgi:hypothetical protein
VSTWPIFVASRDYGLTRAQHDERQKLLRDMDRLSATFFTRGESPEEPCSARHLYVFLLHALR